MTERDQRVADITGIDPREVAVIYDESDVLGAIPIAEIGEDLLVEQSGGNDDTPPGRPRRERAATP